MNSFLDSIVTEHPVPIWLYNYVISVCQVISINYLKNGITIAIYLKWWRYMYTYSPIIQAYIACSI